jgi:putative flippase GtrA
LQTFESIERRQGFPRKSQGRLRRLIEKYAGLLQAGKFAAGSAIGFLDTEIILVLGSYFLYGRLNAPQSAFPSPAFWALNAIAFILGVTVAFFVNETLMLRNRKGYGRQFSLWSVIKRLVKFQLIFLTGNLIIVVVQMFMLREFSFPPFFGNIVGAIVSFPASYFFSMHFVWDSSIPTAGRSQTEGKQQREPWQRSEFGRVEAEKVLRGFRDPNENYDIKVDEYKFDLIDNRENQKVIDFAVRFDVVNRKDKRSKSKVFASASG